MRFSCSQRSCPLVPGADPIGRHTAVARNETREFGRLDGFDQNQARFLDGLEGPDPRRSLLQGTVDALGNAVTFRRVRERRRASARGRGIGSYWMKGRSGTFENGREIRFPNREEQVS